jgi:DNA invertase Pin-like site-specific DNA recombinase
MARKPKIEAVAYLRTSSAANVGREKDSDRRQRKAIEAYAKRAGFEIIAEFYDAAVSGADAIEGRPGFAALLDRIDNNGVRVVLVEDQTRFARDLKVYVLGLVHLRAREVRLITADGHELTSDKDEMTEAMLAIGAVFAGLEKKRLVKKLRAARDRMSEARGDRIEGRPALAPLHQRFPEAVAMAKRLYRANPKSGERRSLREISAELEKAGHLMTSKYRKQVQPRAFNPATIKAMVEGPMRARRDAGDAKSED